LPQNDSQWPRLTMNHCEHFFAGRRPAGAVVTVRSRRGRSQVTSESSSIRRQMVWRRGASTKSQFCVARNVRLGQQLHAAVVDSRGYPIAVFFVHTSRPRPKLHDGLGKLGRREAGSGASRCDRFDLTACEMERLSRRHILQTHTSGTLDSQRSLPQSAAHRHNNGNLRRSPTKPL
jgi:hypothetical protein